MKIYGLNKTTLLDYPGHVASTIFTGGCNMRCPFCQNSDLVLLPQGYPDIPEEEVLAHLRKRRAMLQGVCITGGECTGQADLREFILKVKEMGYLVKIDSNGYRPQVLRQLIDEGIIDMVAMDIKAGRENYANASGCPHIELSRIEESVDLLMNSGIDYEFRTTVVKGIHSIEEFESIGQWLQGSRAYYLQAYREDENVLENVREAMELRERGSVAEPRVFGSFSREEMEQMAEICRKYISVVGLRGIE